MVHANDILHFYIGQQGEFATSDDNTRYIVTIDGAIIDQIRKDPDETLLRPYLRPLASMTEEHAKEFVLLAPSPYGTFEKIDRIVSNGIFYKVQGMNSVYAAYFEKCSPWQFIFLIKHGYDVFGLIALGALDRATMEEETKKL